MHRNCLFQISHLYFGFAHGVFGLIEILNFNVIQFIFFFCAFFES